MIKSKSSEIFIKNSTIAHSSLEDEPICNNKCEDEIIISSDNALHSKNNFNKNLTNGSIKQLIKNHNSTKNQKKADYPAFNNFISKNQNYSHSYINSSIHHNSKKIQRKNSISDNIYMSNLNEGKSPSPYENNKREFEKEQDKNVPLQKLSYNKFKNHENKINAKKITR